MVGGLVSLMWCFTALVFSMARTTPRTSLFPEIDFASKVMRHGGHNSRCIRLQSRHSFQNVLSRLNNSNTYEIWNALAPSKLYIRVADSEVEESRPITMIWERNGWRHCHETDVDGVGTGSGNENEATSERLSQRRHGRI